MSFEYQCRSCEATLRIPDEAIGKVVRCPNCGNTAVASGAVGSGPPEKAGSRPENPAVDSNDFSAPDSLWGPVNTGTGQNDGHGPSGGTFNHPAHQLTQQQQVAHRVKSMAIVWLVFCVVNFLFPAAGLIGYGLGVVMGEVGSEDLGTAIFAGGSALMSVLGFLGAMAAMRMRYHGFCVLASIASMIGGVICCFVPSGVALWALITLVYPGTSDHFR